MRVLIDTNVLVRLSHLSSPQQPIAANALRRLHDEGHELRTVPQVLYEYWAVASRREEHNGLGFAIPVVHSQIHDWRILFPVLKDERGILDPWQQIALDHSVIGKQVHDARLVAAMKRHGLTHILTFNGSDFRRFAGVEVLDPAAVPSS